MEKQERGLWVSPWSDCAEEASGGSAGWLRRMGQHLLTTVTPWTRNHTTSSPSERPGMGVSMAYFVPVLQMLSTGF